MARFISLDVSQKLTAICVVDETGRRLWRGQCATDPGQIERAVRGQAEADARIGVETGPMTPWLVHELRGCQRRLKIRPDDGAKVYQLSSGFLVRLEAVSSSRREVSWRRAQPRSRMAAGHREAARSVLDRGEHGGSLTERRADFAALGIRGPLQAAQPWRAGSQRMSVVPGAVAGEVDCGCCAYASTLALRARLWLGR